MALDVNDVISALATRRTVEAMGENPLLIATFPDRPPVELSGIAQPESRD